MNLTFSSFMTTLIIHSISIPILYLYLNNSKYINKTGIKILLSSVLLSALRLLFPFELLFTKPIYIRFFWPNIYRLFNTTIYNMKYTNINLTKLLITIWILVTLIIIIKKIKSYYYLLNVVNNLDSADSKLIRLLYVINCNYKRSKQFKLVASDFVTTPMVIGIKKPYIILPNIILEDRDWFYIISHELAHYYHGDLLIKFLLELFIAFYWWNPIVYFLKRQVLKLLEINVDTDLIKNWNDNYKVEYISCLVKLANNSQMEKKHNWFVAFKGNDIPSVIQRVQLILDNINNKKKQSLLTSTIVILLTSIIFITPSLFVIEPYSILPEHEQDTFEIKLDNSYYIINDVGTYDLYLNDKYIITQNEIVDYSIKIYNNKEVPK